MEQLAIRDWMIIIGAMMIAAVLLDAVRRYWKERRAEIKLNARIDRSSPLSDDDDAFNLLTELPNGGARIVQRDDLQSDMSAGEVLGSDEPATPRRELEPAAVPVDMGSDVSPRSAPDPIDVAVEALDVGESEQRIASAASDDSSEKGPQGVASEVSPSATQSSAPSAPAAPTDLPAGDQAEKGSEPPPAASTETQLPRRRTVKAAPADVAEPPETEPEVAGTVDWLDTLEPEEPMEPDVPEHGRLPRGADTHVFILYVVARSEEGFSGTGILETLLACDLRFGDMDFFHRHERASGRGPIEFSVANMMKPGVFDIDNMEPLQTRGLMFFVTLPGPTDMLKAFDYMYETVKVVAKTLDGDIQDETRSVITRQSLEHMRQQIRELERRLLVRRN
jgi:cell division protein ZipA